MSANKRRVAIAREGGGITIELCGWPAVMAWLIVGTMALMTVFVIGSSAYHWVRPATPSMIDVDRYHA